VATVSVLGQLNAVDRRETRAFSGRVRLTGGGGSFNQRRGVETPERCEFALISVWWARRVSIRGTLRNGLTHTAVGQERTRFHLR